MSWIFWVFGSFVVLIAWCFGYMVGIDGKLRDEFEEKWCDCDDDEEDIETVTNAKL